MAEDDTLENLVRRLAGLVVKLDERNERFDDWIARQDAINDRLTGAIERIDTTLAGLHRLMREVFRERTNGRTD